VTFEAVTDEPPPLCLTERPGSATEIENARCYARAHRNCSAKITREHFISRSLLTMWMAGKEALEVSGFAHQAGQVQALRPNELASKVLCERCNSALSPLDAAVTNAWDYLEVGAGDGLVLNGHDLERWFVKLLCGHAASRTCYRPRKLMS
jgi:hypothetical protein